MTLNEWLSYVDQEGIYVSDELAADLRREVGVEPCWPTHDVEDTKVAIFKRGEGGSVAVTAELLAWGSEVIESMEGR